MSELYIGLMSGTSLDGIDAVVVDLEKQPKLIANHYSPFSPELRKTILALCQPGHDEINRLGELDVILGKEFAQAVLTLLKNNNITKESIQAIGSHGQTVRHHPERIHPFTLQVGDPNIIATLTGITTVADFRRRDMAEGGQGAPLVPAFHQHLFASANNDRVILNIGGIANVTFLPKNTSDPVMGFDTGPGNTLLDAWIEKHLHETHDKNGDWARSGSVNADLLKKLLADHYFKLSAPKSTGREYFNLTWLEKTTHNMNLLPQDIQATLLELTAQSIIDAIQQNISSGEIFVCGGGAHNKLLMERLNIVGSQFSIHSTKQLGIDPDWVEAIAFAWLAQQTLLKKPGNLPSVTGAKRNVVLGGVYF